MLKSQSPFFTIILGFNEVAEISILLGVPILFKFTSMNPFVPGATTVGFVVNVTCKPVSSAITIKLVFTNKITELISIKTKKYVFLIFLTTNLYLTINQMNNGLSILCYFRFM